MSLPSVRVLIVDDSLQQQCMREVLDACGLAFISASDGAAGVEAARRLQPDIILMDIEVTPPQRIGERNVATALAELERHRIPVMKQFTGGSAGLKVILDSHTGMVWARQPREGRPPGRTGHDPANATEQ